MTHIVVHILVAALMPPLLLGVINKTKAWFAGRVGPPFLQPYYDLLRLIQKGSVFSTTTTWVFRFGPVVGLAAVAVAVMMIPLGHASAPLNFKGDVILLAYLLGLSARGLASVERVVASLHQERGEEARNGTAPPLLDRSPPAHW